MNKECCTPNNNNNGTRKKILSRKLILITRNPINIFHFFLQSGRNLSYIKNLKNFRTHFYKKSCSSMPANFQKYFAHKKNYRNLYNKKFTLYLFIKLLSEIKIQ